jgi:hypothetical protein
MVAHLPVVWQYVFLAVATLAVVLVGLWLYNRREQRRKHAIQLAKLMTRWGMDWFAESYEMYAVGDYSGLAYKVKEVVESVRSDETMVLKLWDVAKKVASHVAENDAAKAAELLQILQGAKPAIIKT